MAKEEYRNPAPTVDLLIEIDAHIVLIERKHAPFGWALPGGFVDEGESVEHAAIREAMEETQLEVTLTELLYVYSNPSRDPRKHTMSSVFVATAQGEPIASDDAKSVALIPIDELPGDEELCFDHAQILRDYLHWRESGSRPDPMTRVVAPSPS